MVPQPAKAGAPSMTEDAWRDWHALPSSAAFLKTTAELDRTRDPKWSKMVHPVSGLEKMGATARSRALLKKRVRKGVPLRADDDALLLEVAYGSDRAPNEGPDHYRRASSEAYPALVSRSSQDPVDPESIYEIIERDLTRTYPRHPMFETALVDGGRSDQSVENKGVSMLRRVLCAYAALDEECGYCQGMNYVAALALVHVCGEDASRNDPMRSMSKRHLGAQASERDLAGSAEEDCFWFLVALLRSRRTSLRSSTCRAWSARSRLFVYGAVLAQLAPKVAAHMAKEGLEPNMYATHWFVTVFSAQFPSLVARVWDAFLAEGWKPVYRVAVALLSTNEKAILAMDFEGLMMWLRTLPDTVDAAAVLKAAGRLPLTTAGVRNLEAKYAEEEAANKPAAPKFCRSRR
ncbi:hypothetical protein JL720_1882 [Aureococcus anophagefferens]|nr:hypothetical protein JL720_1882 [Aureococcus anophagefferens]